MLSDLLVFGNVMAGDGSNQTVIHWDYFRYLQPCHTSNKKKLWICFFFQCVGLLIEFGYLCPKPNVLTQITATLQCINQTCYKTK